MKTITQELKELAHHIKEYTAAKSSTYNHQINATIEKMGKKINEIKNDSKAALLKRYEEVKTQYAEIKEKGEHEKKEAYNKLVNRFDSLNQEIEKNTEEEPRE